MSVQLFAANPVDLHCRRDMLRGSVVGLGAAPKPSSRGDCPGTRVAPPYLLRACGLIIIGGESSFGKVTGGGARVSAIATLTAFLLITRGVPEIRRVSRLRGSAAWATPRSRLDAGKSGPRLLVHIAEISQPKHHRLGANAKSSPKFHQEVIVQNIKRFSTQHLSL